MHRNATTACSHCSSALVLMGEADCCVVAVLVSVGIIGPYGYIAHNTWGTGDWFPDVVAAEKEAKKDDKAMVFKNPLR